MPQTATETVTETQPKYTVPKQCKAGVVVNEGPDFRVVSCSIRSGESIELELQILRIR
jgi:hypothetical protein